MELLADLNVQEISVIDTMITEHGLSLYHDKKTELMSSECVLEVDSLTALKKVKLYKSGVEVVFSLPPLGRQELMSEMFHNLGYILNGRHYALTGTGDFVLDGIKTGFPYVKAVAFTMTVGNDHNLMIARRNITRKTFVPEPVSGFGYETPTGFVFDEEIPDSGFWQWQHPSVYQPCADAEVFFLINGVEYYLPSGFFGVQILDDGSELYADRKIDKQIRISAGNYLTNGTHYHRFPSGLHYLSYYNDIDYDSVPLSDLKAIFEEHIFAGHQTEVREVVIPAGSLDPVARSHTMLKTGRKVAMVERYLTFDQLKRLIKSSPVDATNIVYMLTNLGTAVDFTILRRWALTSGGSLDFSTYEFGSKPLPLEVMPHTPSVRESYAGSVVHGCGDPKAKLVEEIMEFKAEVSEAAFDELGDVVNSYVGALLGPSCPVYTAERHKTLMKAHFPKSHDKLIARTPVNLSGHLIGESLGTISTMPADRSSLKLMSEAPLVKIRYKEAWMYFSRIDSTGKNGEGIYKQIGYEANTPKGNGRTWRYRWNTEEFAGSYDFFMRRGGRGLTCDLAFYPEHRAGRCKKCNVSMARCAVPGCVYEATWTTMLSFQHIKARILYGMYPGVLSAFLSDLSMASDKGVAVHGFSPGMIDIVYHMFLMEHDSSPKIVEHIVKL